MITITDHVSLDLKKKNMHDHAFMIMRDHLDAWGFELITEPHVEKTIFFVIMEFRD